MLPLLVSKDKKAKAEAFIKIVSVSLLVQYDDAYWSYSKGFDPWWCKFEELDIELN